MDQFGVRRETARSVAIEGPPLPLDFHLLADGEALEAAWQTEIRLMIAARRGGAEARAAARRRGWTAKSSSGASNGRAR